MSKELRHNYGHTGDDTLDDILHPDEHTEDSLAEVISIGNGYAPDEAETTADIPSVAEDQVEHGVLPLTKRGKALVAIALVGTVIFGPTVAEKAGHSVENAFSYIDSHLDK